MASRAGYVARFGPGTFRGGERELSVALRRQGHVGVAVHRPVPEVFIVEGQVELPASKEDVVGLFSQLGFADVKAEVSEAP